MSILKTIKSHISVVSADEILERRKKTILWSYFGVFLGLLVLLPVNGVLYAIGAPIEDLKDNFKLVGICFLLTPILIFIVGSIFLKLKKSGEV